jgi:hypothetical protein
MTYLEIVNSVLVRLREQEVSTINENSYSNLISKLVNVVKREIDTSYNWSGYRTTFTLTTADDVFNYVLTGFGTTSKVLHVYNDTDDTTMRLKEGQWFDRAFRMSGTAQKGSPQYYNFNGVDSNGDLGVDVYPIPDKVYELRFNVVQDQTDLSTDSEVVTFNSPIIIEGVLSRAISERGEDGGSQDQEHRYRNLLSDAISREVDLRLNESTWYAT